jgi:GNAT superfamily N-acetyltransferase/ABC-type iron transport system FetAB ATPase subunit
MTQKEKDEEEVEWIPLERVDIPLISDTPIDELTQALVEPFDYSAEHAELFYPYKLPLDFPTDFGVGIIVGASGTGKSTLLSEFGEPVFPKWEPDMTIASHFTDPTDANERLSAAGLMSVPDWVKPFAVLSNGQKFRANLARQLINNAVIDEYTSVVDRNVAKAASSGLARYVRKNGVRGIVLATVHRDIIEYLEPDWIIDTDRGLWTSGRWLHRPDLVFEVQPCERTLWAHFSHYHYLSESLNPSARCYMATWEGQLVGFVATMSYPSGSVQNAFREHRLVIHPDYQGLGIGPRLSEAIAQVYIDNGKRYFSKTSHPRLGEYRDQSKKWKATSKNHMKRKDGQNLDGAQRWAIDPKRWSYSHEYIGETST